MLDEAAGFEAVSKMERPFGFSAMLPVGFSAIDPNKPLVEVDLTGVKDWELFAMLSNMDFVAEGVFWGVGAGR